MKKIKQIEQCYVCGCVSCEESIYCKDCGYALLNKKEIKEVTIGSLLIGFMSCFAVMLFISAVIKGNEETISVPYNPPMCEQSESK